MVKMEYIIHVEYPKAQKEYPFGRIAIATLPSKNSWWTVKLNTVVILETFGNVHDMKREVRSCFPNDTKIKFTKRT
jgi:hypothetical protein